MVAPKGLNSKAQGIALGDLATLKMIALKGRYVLPRDAWFRPFRATVATFPRSQGVALGFRVWPLRGERAATKHRRTNRGFS